MALPIFQHQQLQFDLEVRCVMVFFEASCSCELCRSASFAFSFCVSAHSVQRRFFRADKTLIVVKVWFAEEIFSFVQLAPSQSCRLGATLVNFRFRMRDRVSDICRFACAHINVGFGSWIWSGHHQSSCRPLNYKKRVFGVIFFIIIFFVFDLFLAIVFWTCSRNPTSDQHVSGLDFLTYP